MANETRPLFRPGAEVTVQTTTAVTGKRFVGVSATRDTVTGLVQVAAPAAGSAPFGVAAADIASNTIGLVQRGGILFVTAGGAITAGAAIEVDNVGRAVTRSTGVAVGVALETVAGAGLDVLVSLSIGV